MNAQNNAILVKLLNFGDNGIFKIHGKNLHCFIPEFSEYQFNTQWEKNKGKSIIGKEFNAELFLQFVSLNKTMSETSCVKKIKWFTYAIQGKIVSKNKYTCIIDCDILINIELPHKKSSSKFKIGNWIKSTGRLDIHLKK